MELAWFDMKSRIGQRGAEVVGCEVELRGALVGGELFRSRGTVWHVEECNGVEWCGALVVF